MKNVPARYQNSKYVNGLATRASSAAARATKATKQLKSTARIAWEHGVAGGAGALAGGGIEEGTAGMKSPVPLSIPAGALAIAGGAGAGSTEAQAFGWGMVHAGLAELGKKGVKALKVRFNK